MIRFTYLLLLVIFSQSISAGQYAGSATCGGCHKDEHALWQKSDHFHAMQPAEPGFVLGDFNNRSVSFHGLTSRFFREGERFMVETTGDDGLEAFEVAYTFGHRPLQQYLLKVGNDQMQAFNIAWDNRTIDEGGQRWFHLRSEMEESSPFFWTGYLQNWNSQCADCHSTGVQRKTDPETRRALINFEEVNVGCEACHGPRENHVKLAMKGGLPEASANAGGLRWHREADKKVAEPVGGRDESVINMCGGCHSHRQVIGEGDVTSNYHDRYQLSLIDDVLYEKDGAVREEVFVLGSFLQSKMHERGVTCTNCHEPHSGEVRFEGDKLCTQCHAPTVHRENKSLWAQKDSGCVSCHMPIDTFMQIDERRDHAFIVPRKDVKTAFELVNEGLVTRDPTLVEQWMRYVEDSSHPAIRRASVLSRVPVTDESIRASLRLLDDKSALVRRAATRVLLSGPSVIARMLVSDLAGDEALAVRLEAASGLASILPELDTDQARAVLGLISEYRASLALSADSPATMTRKAMLNAATGDPAGAIREFEAALAVEPQYLPARLNYADLLRSLGRGDAARDQLEIALGYTPDSADVQHSYGLMLVREGEHKSALEPLRKAAAGEDSNPRYAYVYAVALESRGQMFAAIQSLVEASERWPNQYELLVLEVRYRDQVGAVNSINRPLLALARIAGNDPGVKAWLEKYPLD